MARHKYVWTIGLFVLIVGFIDDNSYYNYFLLKKDNAELDKEIKKYEDKFNHDYAKLRQLKTDPIPPKPYTDNHSDKEYYQLTPFIDIEEEQLLLPSIPNCEMGRWHPAFVDVTAKGNTKQRGIDEIIRHFGIRLEETMAFGDGGNDISMLRHAGIGVAMGNAKDDVKAAAGYVTTSVDDNGIANALKQYGIIES